jgi:transcriptional regulator with XRE-family HTH domain
MTTTVGQRIRELRLAGHLTQRDLAEQVGVSVPHVSKIEAGAETASDDLLVRLAAVLNTDPDGLLLLAERVPEELRQVAQSKQGLAVQFFRKWKSGEISDDDVRRLVGEDK